ncbi:MAG: phosphoribosylaminoimidazolesuccinocarboxamide synthase [Bacteroidales bacterium]
MQQPIVETQFNLPGQKDVYKGKVRDVYNINDEYLVMIVTDRISAFDVVLPKGIPYKGQVLNQIAERFLNEAASIVPTWKIDTPDPNVMIGHKAEAFPVEMVVRGYLTGHAWREYKAGKRQLCGEPLLAGMKQHQKFDKPIITPTTKAHEGHDEDISKDEIIKQGLVSKEDYELLEKYSLQLFEQGTKLAAEKGLILVDTKYEFGKKDGKIYLIDEIHTPDSSRYFYSDGYWERFQNNEPQKQLSKEFVREWLIEQGFQGNEDEQMPEIPEDFVKKVSERYIELYEKLTGEEFHYTESENVEKRIENNINKALAELSVH